MRARSIESDGKALTAAVDRRTFLGRASQTAGAAMLMGLSSARVLAADAPVAETLATSRRATPDERRSQLAERREGVARMICD